MKTYLRIFIAISVSLVLSTVVFADDNSDGEFNLNSIEGTWAAAADGNVLVDIPSIEVDAGDPVALIGLVTFDSDGTCTISNTINTGGFVASATSASCMVTVNSDGTGQIVANFPPPTPSATLNIVVVDDNEIFVLRSDQDFVNRGVFKRQNGWKRF